MHSLGSGLLGVLQLLQLRQEGIQILELAVDRRKADVCHVVPLLQLDHDHFAKLAGVDLLHQVVLQLRLDLGGDLLTLHRTLLARLHNTGKHLGAIEQLLAAIKAKDVEAAVKALETDIGCAVDSIRLQ